jgi:DNA-binding CsgD family transcriptional regulator
VTSWNMPSRSDWAGGRRRAGGGITPPVRGSELASDQTLLLDVIASVAHAVVAYDARGEAQYARIGRGAAAAAGAALAAAMEGLGKAVAYDAVDGDVGERSTFIGVAPVLRDIATAAGRFRLRAVRFQPGFFGSHASVLVIAERLRDEAPNHDSIRHRFKLTAREAEVATLLAERRSNADIARALGISVHTARHHTERVLLKLGACKRHDVQRVLRSAPDAETERDEIDSAGPASGAAQP